MGSMEEDELEEGEALEEDGAVDLDHHFSYIDKKIQDVLGHLQKDFEGAVSSDDLGAKFGMYGSFLPMYRWSPSSLSRARSPQRFAGLRPPSDPHCEGACPSATGPPMGVAAPSRGKVVSTTRLLDDSGKVDAKGGGLPASSPQPAPSSRPMNSNDTRTLKVRIKMGQESISTRDKAAIYSGLGLDGSPSPSPKVFSNDGELSHKSESMVESPSTIFQFYTCFQASRLVPCLLSPFRESPQMTEQKTVLAKDGKLAQLSESKQSTELLRSCKLVEKAPKKSKCKDGGNDISVVSRKEPDIETVAGKKILSDSLPSKTKEEKNQKMLKDPSGGDFVSQAPAEVVGREKICLSGLVDDAHIVSSTPQKFERTDTQQQTGKHGSKPSDEKIPQVIKVVARSGEVAKNTGEGMKDNVNSSDSLRKDFEGIKGNRDVVIRHAESIKIKVPQKYLLLSEDTERIPSRKDKLSEVERKPNDNQLNGLLSIEVHGGANTIPVKRLKEKKKTSQPKEQAECLPHVSKHHADGGRTANMERVGAFLGAKQGCRKDDLQKKHLRIKDRRQDHKSNDMIGEKPKEKSGLRRLENPPKSAEPDKDMQDAIVNDDAALLLPGSAYLDAWVCCDKCETWRLLPYGTEAKDLPDKWVCSMLTWLPGMNSCDITQKETEEALRALYVSQDQATVTGHNDVANSSITFADPQYASQTFDPVHQSVSSATKKKLVVKEVSNRVRQPVSHPVEPVKENSSTSAKRRNLSDANQVYVGKVGSQRACNSSEFSTEQHKNKFKGDQLLAKHSAGDAVIIEDRKKKKLKSKKDLAEESLRASKKIKLRDSRVLVEDHLFNYSLDGTDLDTNGFSSKINEENSREDKFLSSKCHLYENKDRLFHGKVKVGLSASLHVEKSDTTKKRKIKDVVMGQTLQVDVGRQEITDAVSKKAKKVKDSNAIEMEDKKENHLSKFMSGSLLPDGNVRNQADVSNLLLQSERNANDADSLKFYYSQHSTAATSSSSKVSGSRKSKCNFFEGRSSPVESVSSSPLRASNIDKHRGKVEKTHKVFDPRSSDCDVNGSYEQSRPKSKEKSTSVKVFSWENKRVAESRPLKAKTIESTCNIKGKEMGQLPSKAKDLLFVKIFGSNDDEPSPMNCENVKCNNAAMVFDDRNGFSGEFQAKDGDRRKEQLETCDIMGLGSQKKSGKNTSRQAERQKNSLTEYEKGFKSQSNGMEKRKQNCPGITVELKHSLHSKGENSVHYGSKVNAEAKDNTFSLNKHRDSLQLAEETVDFGNGNKCNLQENSYEALSRVEEKEKCPQVRLYKSVEEDALSRKGKPEAVNNVKDDKEDPQSHIESISSKGSRDVKSTRATDGDVMNASKQSKRMDASLKNATSNDAFTDTQPRKDGGQSYSNVLKEARDLKHSAKHLKDGGSEYESVSLYFQAALKFLLAASLLEPTITEIAKYGDNTQWVQMYSDTGKFCKFVAVEFEKHKDLASAALAYKCMEVAYMKVVYSKHFTAVKDHHELQNAHQIGESPSSSASDVDNLNNHTTVDKGAAIKAINSPQIAGNHLLAGRNRPNFTRILNFAEDVNAAMEASRKSLNAFTSASASQIDVLRREGIESVKRVLDFNFHDVEGLLRLVRSSMEVIGR